MIIIAEIFQRSYDTHDFQLAHILPPTPTHEVYLPNKRHSTGTNVPAGDCVPSDAGYDATITASTIDPFYSINGNTGAGAENTVASTGT